MPPRKCGLPPPGILLIENNEAEVRLLREAFGAAGCAVTLIALRNAQQAMTYLRREGNYEASSRPAFILLDLNLPGTTGAELLAEIKRERALRSIPVIVLSTSTCTAEIARAYELGAN